MLSKKEINISNQSYTKKDFATIYPELVDFIRNIVTYWDPKTSSETDPGVVLTKEAAFIGDKVNYNIDKNTLEIFMPSCTQETSMRQNCESRGYEMQYYNSATTLVTFTYNGEKLNDNDKIILNAYDTIVKSADDSIFYTITQQVEFSKDRLSVDVPAIEGSLNTLTVASSTDEYTIQLVNLDDNNRIYFPVSAVAQNGVFISNARGSWRRETNLNVIQPGSLVYKFGFSSKRGLPYVEFPTDIASLIDSGLTINYLVTNGKNGNVKAGFISALAKTVGVKVINGETSEYQPDLDKPDIYIKNESASVNGSDPQSVNEAYEDYKRTIGVFDTLVACRDYESAIYNMYDVNETFPIVSNTHVADRRDDINYGVRYVSFDGNATIYKNYTSGSAITPYDLCVYNLSPMYSDTLEDYYVSFKPIPISQYIKDELENSKCASHDYKTIVASDIHTIKNIATLDVGIATTYKVNNYERAQIIQNIQKALVDNFNARKVSYGQELSRDYIQKVIENADSRISYANVPEPTLTTSYVNIEGDEVAQLSTSGVENQFAIVVARNVLSGKVSLLNFDDEFDYDFGRSDTHSLSNLSKITSGTTISLSANVEYELRDNEAIQMIGPSLIVDVPYGAYVYYCWLPSNTYDVIPANTNYQLKSGDRLYLYYVDGNKQAHQDLYEANTIVETSFNVNPTTPQTSGGGRVYKEINGTGFWYISLGAQDSINIKKLNKVTLEETTNCYWLRNDVENRLFRESDAVTIGGETFYEITLGDDEYFFYTNAGFNTLYTLGSGTTIRTNIAPDDDNSNDVWKAKRVSLQEIVENGLLSLTGVWKLINFNSSNYLEAQENAIVTLTQGDKIKLSENKSLSNTPVAISSSATCVYTIADKPDNLPNYNVSGMQWLIKSRLDINASKTKSQTLQSGQSITFTNKDNTTLSISSGTTFNLNLDTNIAGGTNIDVSSLNAKNEQIWPLSVYSYTLDSASNLPDRVNSQYWTIKFASSGDKTLNIPSISGKNSILTVYLPQSGTTFTLSATDSSSNPVTLYKYKQDTLSGLSDEGIYTIAIPSNVVSLKITSSGTGNIILDIPRFYDGYNSQLGVYTICKELQDANIVQDADAEAAIVYNVIETYIKNHSDSKFYYCASIDNARVIEGDDLSSPLALYDYNNVANKFTITEIDIENSKIDVYRSSRL